MSNGASIPQLLRIHFSGIGHPDARLSPLTLNFFRENESGQLDAIDSVIWAENGVGKSSIRALLFSLLHPTIHDVMRSTNGPMDNRRYELFFGSRDSSYVITEWMMPPKQQPTLTGIPEAPSTLIVGFVAHWPRHHQTTLSDLDRHFFMFRPEGSMTFDRMPVRGLAKGTEPAPHAKDFLEWFKANAKPVGGRHTTVHKEWSNWLAEEGLDPVLFAYQLRMNSGQGGILGLFKNRINSSADFVHFFLETVLNHDIASDVISVLNEKKVHIEKKPQWEAEVTFVDEALPMLDALQGQKSDLDQAVSQLESDKLEAGSLIVGLGLSEQNLKHTKENTRYEAQELEARINDQQKHIVNYQDYRSWLKYHECTLAFDAAENGLAKKKEAHDEVFKEYALLKSAREYVAWQEKLDECKAIQTELQGRDNEHLDVEESLHNAGAALTHVLDREIKAGKAMHDQAKEDLLHARKELISNQKELTRTKTELGKIKETIRGINAQMSNREKVLRRLANGQVLGAEESPTDGVTRWKQRLAQSGKDIKTAVKLRLELDEEKKRIQDIQHDNVVRLTRARHDVDQLTRDLQSAESRKKALEKNSELQRAAEENTVNLANPDLTALVRERIVHIQQEIFSQSRRLADERETLEVIEKSESKLYPPPVEVAKLLAVLRDELKINASLGTELLDSKFADDPAEAERRFTQDPARYMGIIVPDKKALDQIRKQASAIHRPAFPVQISLADGALADEPADAVVLAPGHRAAFNRQAAKEIIKPLKTGIIEKEKRIAEYHQTVRKLEQTLTELTVFLELHPNGKLRDLRDRLNNKKTVLTDLDKIQQTNKNRVAEIDALLTEKLEEIKKAEQLQQQAESAIDRLRDFIEDHESQFRQLRADLMETRAQLHLTEDKAMRLEATLEEDQRLVGERQGNVFNHKSAVDRKKEQMRGVVYKSGDPGDITDLTLSEAETTYNLNLDRFRQVSEKDETLRARLEEKQAMAGEREERFRKELGEYDEGEVVTILEEGHVDDRLQSAEIKERNANMAVGAAEGALNASRDRLREAPTMNLDYEPPQGEELPKTAESAHKRRDEVETQLEGWRTEIDLQKEKLTEIRDRQRQIESDISFRQIKREELINHAPDYAESDNAELPQGNDALKEMLDSFWERFRKNRKHHSDMRLAVDAACDKLKDLASDVRFQDFPNDKREVLKIKESLLRQTEDIINEFYIFRDVIQSSLRMSEESTEAIITRLDAGISDALHLINLSKSSSRLPEAMEGWGGLSFLKMELPGKVPQTLEDRKPIYERVLREALQSGKNLRGLDLIKRGIDALAGARGYKVEIMKPGYSLKTDSHSIMEVKGWSDGEKITSVILIYCTMVQLRAISTGGKSAETAERRLLSNGMLFLDNPFGEANSLTFVNMQLTMARALNIQLVYTASGSHKHLMARFPRVLRLSQETGNEKTFVKSTDVGQEVRSSVNVTAAQFGRRRVAV